MKLQFGIRAQREGLLTWSAWVIDDGGPHWVGDTRTKCGALRKADRHARESEPAVPAAR